MTTTTPIHLSRPSLPDDRLKDLDCIGFVYRLPEADRAPWLTWMQRIRLADRLAETDTEALRMLRSFDYGDEPAHVARHWLGYLDALAKYHSGYVVKTLAEHDEMLGALSGNIVCLMPGLPVHLLDAAYHFGALDQFYNNLRDMQEDAERGLCWLPEEVLRKYGIARADVIAWRAPEMFGWRMFMQQWTIVHAVELHRRAAPMADVTLEAELPESLRAMCMWTTRRYRRIEHALAVLDYDYRRFPAVYWSEVRRELGSVEAHT